MSITRATCKHTCDSQVFFQDGKGGGGGVGGGKQERTEVGR